MYSFPTRFKLNFFHIAICTNYSSHSIFVVSFSLQTVLLTALHSRPQVEVPDLLERRWSGSRGVGDICPLRPRTLLSGALHENVSKGPSFIALQKLILVLNSKEAESHVCTLNIFIADAYR